MIQTKQLITVKTLSPKYAEQIVILTNHSHPELHRKMIDALLDNTKQPVGFVAAGAVKKAPRLCSLWLVEHESHLYFVLCPDKGSTLATMHNPPQLFV